MSVDFKKVLVVGTGGIGGYYGAKLAQAGHQVSFVCRSDFEHVRQHGLQIQSYQGDFHVQPSQVLRDPREYKDQADLILVATKVVPEIDLPTLLEPVLHPGSAILLIQNGIEIEKPLSERFPQIPLFSAIAFIGVSKIKPGVIHHQLRGNLEIGSYPANAPTQPDLWVDIFNQTGIETKKSENIERSRWKKLIWNLAFNPISVLTQANTQEMLENPKVEALAPKIMAEVIALGRARGYQLEDHLIEKNMAATYKMPPYKTSMLLDFLNDKPLETQAILDNPLQIGAELHIQTPYIETLAALTELLIEKKKS